MKTRPAQTTSRHQSRGVHSGPESAAPDAATPARIIDLDAAHRGDEEAQLVDARTGDLWVVNVATPAPPAPFVPAPPRVRDALAVLLLVLVPTALVAIAASIESPRVAGAVLVLGIVAVQACTDAVLRRRALRHPTPTSLLEEP